VGIQHFVVDGSRNIISFQIVEGIANLPYRNKDFKLKLEALFSRDRTFHSGLAKKNKETDVSR
jgi:hypothetical protein